MVPRALTLAAAKRRPSVNPPDGDPRAGSEGLRKIACSTASAFPGSTGARCHISEQSSRQFRRLTQRQDGHRASCQPGPGAESRAAGTPLGKPIIASYERGSARPAVPMVQGDPKTRDWRGSPCAQASSITGCGVMKEVDEEIKCVGRTAVTQVLLPFRLVMAGIRPPFARSPAGPGDHCVDQHHQGDRHLLATRAR